MSLQSNNPEAEVTMPDGRRIQLRYEFNCLCDAEEATGLNLMAAQDALMDGTISGREFRGLFYAMIVPYDGFPKEAKDQLTLCGNFVNAVTRPEILEAMAYAIALAVSAEYAEDFRQRVLSSRNHQDQVAAAVQQEAAQQEAPAAA